MSDKKDRPMDPTSILATLEHISQAIDAMTAVVDELREYLGDHWEVVETSNVALEPEELEFVDLACGVPTVH